MIYEVAVIYDGVARAYLPPVFVSNRDVALRGFANAANDINHQIGRNPVDFSMFILGTWDDEQSKFVLLPERISLGLAASYVRPQNVQSAIASTFSDDSQLRKGSKGGNSAKHVRPEPRPQDDV